MEALVRSMEGKHPARPCLVLSNNPEAKGLLKAEKLGLDTAAVDHKKFNGDREAFETEMIKIIDLYQPDIIALAGFMRILSSKFIDHYEGQIINIHPSLLPKYRGLNTHQRAIDAGDREAGCTVHKVTSLLDDGPILGQAVVPICPDDTADILAKRVLEKEHILYREVLKKFAIKNQFFIQI